MRKSSIILLAAVLAIPGGVSAWSSNGASEPNSELDSATFLWPTAPGAATDRIYFNGFTLNAGPIVSTGVNINVAAIGTRMQPMGIEGYVAILGKWVDCNGDGYIGLAETAMREYDAALLLDDRLCLPSVGPVNEWSGSHNYNGWVSELVPIGTDGGQQSAGPGANLDDTDGDGFDDDNDLDLRIIRDPEARIWGDYGRPSDVTAATGGTCPIRPFPRGTMSSSGGVLDYVDCRMGLLEAWNRAFGDDIVIADQTLPGIGDPLGLRFSDDDDGRSGTVGQIDTLGSEDSNQAALVVSDCKADPTFDSGATFNATHEAAGNPLAEEDKELVHDAIAFKVFPLAPQPHDTTSPTVAGQVNQTSEESFGDCDTSNDAGADTYGTFEADFEGTTVTDKRQANFNMEFEDAGILQTMPRGGVGFFTLVEGDLPEGVRDGRSGATLNNMIVTHDWFSRASLVKGTVPMTRGGFTPSVDKLGPDADFITYYAYVGTASLGLGLKTPGGEGKYGADQCGSQTSGVHGGWQCDASLWYVNGIGTPMPESQGGFGRPHMTYNLRDVDCEDGGNDLGVPVGPAGLLGTACKPFR